MLRVAYILNRRDDWIWFIGLPFVAIAIAFASQQWLSVVAVASFGLWVTIPHHFAGWLKAYGHPEDRVRWRVPLIVGPVSIFLVGWAGVAWAPMTLFLVIWAWDHQHSIMQQYGLARIYDFKAGADSPAYGRFDLALNWVLYLNLLIVAPVFAEFWVRELFRFGVRIDAATLELVQSASASLTIGFVIAYAAHAAWSVRQGRTLNPMKFLFIGASYFLWYSTAWWLASVLLITVAHGLMHGVQYIVMVYSYLRRRGGDARSVAVWLTQPRHLIYFLAACLFYAVLYQIITNQPMATFGFGLIDYADEYSDSIDALGKPGLSEVASYELFATLVIHCSALVHYYVDSFIWKVSDTRLQKGL